MEAAATATRWACIGVALLTVSCDFVHDEVLDGPYRAVAVDVRADMALCRTSKQRDCLTEIDATVFQIGWDANYVVAARHPRDWPNPPYRGITEFFYIVRAPSEEDPSTRIVVKGPFDQVQYEEEKQRLKLPEFSRIFNDLK